MVIGLFSISFHKPSKRGVQQRKEGMTLFENGGEIRHIPAVTRKVFDVTGAGDTVISTLSLGLASGMDLKAAAIISNFVAGIVVGEMGTSTVNVEDLKSAIHVQGSLQGVLDVDT